MSRCMEHVCDMQAQQLRKSQVQISRWMVEQVTSIWYCGPQFTQFYWKVISILTSFTICIA